MTNGPEFSGHEVFMVENILDHIAFACNCGSVDFNLLKSGNVECSKCGIIHLDKSWEFKNESKLQVDIDHEANEQHWY